MGLEKLKEYYKGLSVEEIRNNLSLDLALMKITGQLDPKYAIMLHVVQKEKILDQSEINEYKVKGFNALMQNWKD